MKPHEKRALNFLVNEYLLHNRYKLTSITFSEENDDQVTFWMIYFYEVHRMRYIITFITLLIEFSLIILIKGFFLDLIFKYTQFHAITRNNEEGKIPIGRRCLLICFHHEKRKHCFPIRHVKDLWKSKQYFTVRFVRAMMFFPEIFPSFATREKLQNLILKTMFPSLLT